MDSVREGIRSLSEFESFALALGATMPRTLGLFIMVPIFHAELLPTMLRLGAEREVLRVVADQHGAPTAAADLAAALAHIACRLASEPDAPTGTFHFSNAGQTTWADFATEIFRLSAARGGPCARVEPITTADYPTPARRPH